MKSFWIVLPALLFAFHAKAEFTTDTWDLAKNGRPGSIRLKWTGEHFQQNRMRSSLDLAKEALLAAGYQVDPASIRIHDRLLFVGINTMSRIVTYAADPGSQDDGAKQIEFTDLETATNYSCDIQHYASSKAPVLPALAKNAYVSISVESCRAERKPASLNQASHQPKRAPALDWSHMLGSYKSEAAN